MDKKELLESYLGQEKQNLFCASANYLMTVPKKGWEQLFYDTLEKITLLESMIQDEAAKPLTPYCPENPFRGALINSK